LRKNPALWIQQKPDPKAWIVTACADVLKGLMLGGDNRPLTGWRAMR
jgi:hypothetical protein